MRSLQPGAKVGLHRKHWRGRLKVRSNVVQLVQHRRPPHECVVRCCEDLLRRAREGQVRGLVVGMSTWDGCAAYTWTLGDGSIATLLAAVAYLNEDLVAYRGE